MKYIKNKIFLVSLTLALCLVMIFSVFYVMGIHSGLASSAAHFHSQKQCIYTHIKKA